MNRRPIELAKRAAHESLSKVLPDVLRFANDTGNAELRSWARLELLGYFNSNEDLTDKIVVPKYRTIAGTWHDEYGRTLVLDDPDLGFVNETRLRAGVAELEGIATARSPLSTRLPQFSTIIREQLDVEVSIFRFAPSAVPSVLDGIRAKLLDLINAETCGVHTPRAEPDGKAEEILELKPNFMGVGVNLRALWRKMWSQ